MNLENLIKSSLTQNQNASLNKVPDTTFEALTFIQGWDLIAAEKEKDDKVKLILLLEKDEEYDAILIQSPI